MLIMRTLPILLLSFAFVGCVRGSISGSSSSGSGSTTLPSTGTAASGPVRGVAVIDLATGSVPGTYNVDYLSPSLSALQSLAGRGIKVIRLPILWERIQPTLGGALDNSYLTLTLQALADANAAGLKVIVDIHNYGRFNGVPFGDASGPTQTQYADLWTKLTTAINANQSASSSIYGWGLMNEPHDLTAFPGTLSAPVTFTGFESTVEGWVGLYGADTVAQVTRAGQGSLSVTANAQSGSGLVFSTAIAATSKQAMLTDGGIIRFKGFVPTSTPGTISVRAWMQDSSYTPSYGPVQAITKGSQFTYDFTPPSGVWSGNQAIGFDFVVDGSDGSAPFVWDIDDVSQGVAVTGALTPIQVWQHYSQTALSAIRTNSDTRLVLVGGYAYSSAVNWASLQPTGWITDPSTNFKYEAHVYADEDGSGGYANTFAAETTLATGEGYASVAARYVARVKVFTDWTTAQNVGGFIGEFGWPSVGSAGATAPDGASWNTVGDTFLQYLDTVKMDASMWAAGSGLTNTDANLVVYGMNPFTAYSSSSVLEAHITK